MYSPVHGAAGLLLAQVMPDPASAFLVGIASHYVLDAVPHGDTGFGSWLTGGHARRRILTVETVDLGIAAIVVLALVASHPGQWWLKLVAGAVGAITPDLLWGLRFVLDAQKIRLPLLTPFLRHHDRWHAWGHARPSYDMPFAVGLAVQSVLLALVFLLHL